MKWKRLVDFKCPNITCKGSLITKKSEGEIYPTHYCKKCDFYITAPRFNEIVRNILNPRKFTMPEAPDFIKEIRENLVNKPVDIGEKNVEKGDVNLFSIFPIENFPK